MLGLGYLSGDEQEGDLALVNFNREIAQTFSMLDADGSGEVEAEEFVEGLQLLVNGNNVKDRQVMESALACDYYSGRRVLVHKKAKTTAILVVQFRLYQL